MGIYSEAIQRLYVAYFNRPADPAGLDYWDKAITAAKGSTGAVSAAFAASDEYKTTYANLNSAQIVNKVYQNLFGHTADNDTNGLEFWSKALANKLMTIDNMVTQIASGAQGTDLIAFNSKTMAAAAFTNALDTVVETLAYTGDRSNQIGKAFIATVVDDATLKAAITPENLDKVIGSMWGGPPPPPLTFNLTIGQDTLIGTAGNDVFMAYPFNPANGLPANTMSAFDSVDGGLGSDVLNVQISASLNSSFATIKNIETINIYSDVSTDIDASQFQGVTLLRQVGKAGAVSDLATSTIAAFQGSAISGSLNVGAGGSSASVFLEGISDDASLSFSGKTLRTVTVSGVRTHDGTGRLAPMNLAVSAGTNVASVKVSTDQASKLTINEDSVSTTHVTSLDASGSTGAITFDATRLPAVTNIVTGSGDDTISVVKVAGTHLAIAAGAGNDTVYLTGAPEAGDSIDGGAGTNTLVIAGVDPLEGIAISKLVSGFSSIKFVYSSNTSAVDASQLASAYGVIEMGTGGSIINVGTQSLVANGNLVATSASYSGAGKYGGNLGITETANGVITAKADSVDLTVKAVTAGVSAILNGDVQSANVVLGGGDSHAASITVRTDSATLAGLKSLTLSGNGDADVTNSTGTKLTTVNATGLVGAKGLTYSSTSALAETIRLGAGVDHLVLGNSTQENMDMVYGLKLVVNAAGTALASASDTLSVGGVNSSVKLFTTAQSDIDLALKEASASAKGDDLVFALGGDTYIYHDNGNNLIDGSDVFVKLVGVTDTRAVIIALGGNPG